MSKIGIEQFKAQLERDEGGPLCLESCGEMGCSHCLFNSDNAERTVKAILAYWEGTSAMRANKDE